MDLIIWILWMRKIYQFNESRYKQTFSILLQKNNVQLLLLGTLTICLSMKLDEEWGLLKKLL